MAAFIATNDYDSTELDGEYSIFLITNQLDSLWSDIIKCAIFSGFMVEPSRCSVLFWLTRL